MLQRIPVHRASGVSQSTCKPALIPAPLTAAPSLAQSSVLVSRPGQHPTQHVPPTPTTTSPRHATHTARSARHVRTCAHWAPFTAECAPEPFWASHVSKASSLQAAVHECVNAIKRQSNGGCLPDIVDVALVFVSSAFANEYDQLVWLLRQRIPGLKAVVGCSGIGVIGTDEEGAHEVESVPALSLTLMRIPQAELVVRAVTKDNLPDADASPSRWSTLLGVPPFSDKPQHFVVMADPAFGGLRDLLAGMDFAFPAATKLGGLGSMGSLSRPASVNYRHGMATWAWSAGIPSPDQASDSGVWRRGAAVLAIHGDVAMDLIISQGCRPLTGNSWSVDAVCPHDPTHILAMSCEAVADGESLPALEAFQREVQSVLYSLSEEQLDDLMSHLTVGLEPSRPLEFGLPRPSSLACLEQRSAQQFLIRPLMGVDHNDEGIMVGDAVRVGQRLRFMVRDEAGAREDLEGRGLAYKRRQLQSMMVAQAGGGGGTPFGMLMFTSAARGSELFGEPSHDARTVTDFVPVPCAGLQGGGEIGTLGGATHLHSFTCAVGVLRPTTELCPITSGSSGASTAAALPPRQQQQQQQGGNE